MLTPGFDLEESECVAQYMRRRFDRLQTGGDSRVPIPPSWSLQFTVECDHAVQIIWEAVNNSCRSNA